jgi:hypothetical protein
VRLYPAQFIFNFTISNLDKLIDVAEVIPPALNFNVTLRTDDGASSVQIIEGSISTSVLTASIGLGDSLAVGGEAITILSNATCPALVDMCVDVLPALGSSYNLSTLQYSKTCYDVTSIKDCDGKHLKIEMG